VRLCSCGGYRCQGGIKQQKRGGKTSKEGEGSRDHQCGGGDRIEAGKDEHDLLDVKSKVNERTVREKEGGGEEV